MCVSWRLVAASVTLGQVGKEERQVVYSSKYASWVIPEALKENGDIDTDRAYEKDGTRYIYLDPIIYFDDEVEENEKGQNVLKATGQPVWNDGENWRLME